MDSRPVVFDISSDEEGWGETRDGGGCGGDDYDWISELLEKVHGEPDDSDDVVLVSEVVPNPKPRSKPSSVAKEKELDDDDCVILDCDPDKPVVIENNDAGDSDDLLIVGEKGQLACRDYPHARHLCAKFPFSSTPHESHCHQCHCYVCDSLAPCVHWGNATSSIDHCHATDKVEFWKLQRRNLKQGDRAPLPVPKLPDISVSTPQQTIQVPPPAPLQPNNPAHNQVSRSTTIRACSTSSHLGFPNIRNHGGSQQSTYVIPRNKFRPELVSQQLPTTRNNVIPGGRAHSAGNVGPHVNSHPIFKRAGSAGVPVPNNRSGYNSSHNNHVNRYSRNPSATAASNNKNLTTSRDFSSGISTGSHAHQAPSRQNTSSRFGNLVPSHHQVSSHRSVGSGFSSSVPSRPAVSSHSNLGSRFVNSAPSSHPSTVHNFDSLPSQPQVSSQPGIGSGFVNSVPSPQASSKPNMGSNFENLTPSQQLVTSQPNTSSSFVHSVPYQPQEYIHPVPVSNDGFQQGNETQNALELPDFSTTWVAPGQSNQPSLADGSQILCTEPTYHTPFVPEFNCHSDQPSLADGSQFLCAEPTYHPPFVPEFDPQSPITANGGSMDFPYDSWVLDSQSVSGALEVPVPPGLNLYSPESVPVDAGLSFVYSPESAPVDAGLPFGF
ncbi:ABC transporter H family member protein [Actinidia chinensis var. chinensis]|uniref:ABC transporter H family member protein n=1 Tax=Actinidia chinensis var. chinensis TaxID=1590841 RepID=A0A2R6P6X7_ACTCC|nr:ABC transporter H family member protein [Actinidia chinensis var. chinensis]